MSAFSQATLIQREKKYAYHKEWVKANRDKVNAYSAKWRENNLERAREASRNHYHRNKHLRDWHQGVKYGLTKQEVLALYEASDGLCAICYKESARIIDHNHKTGQIRGVLCYACNTALAALEKGQEWIDSALAYLEEGVIYNGGI